jgi:hypothetical protein
MSYDYLVCRAPQGASPRMDFAGFEPEGTLGTAEAVKAAISAEFSGVQWTQRTLPTATVWLGRGGPEFQLTVTPAGEVDNFMMSRASEADVRRLLAATGWVALDLQEEAVLTG